MINPNFSLLLPEQWDYDILEDGRIVYFKRSKSEDSTVPFQWIPPLDTWKQLNNLVSQEPSVMYLPYGIEMAYDATGNLYYLSHITMQTLRDLPEGGKVETRDIISKKLKEVNISRHPLVGYGFMLSSNPPLFVSHVVPGGPADGKLTQGDLLYTIHGHDISIQVSTDDVLGAIDTPLDPHVLQIAVVPKPKPRNKRPPPPPPTHKAKVF
ncbi:hypothetical protein LOD99_8635 [Oopsacas minuta]|uniref:PDZ domain-containing protein n=1 Tax=Oopsacas minuta TaxID=111878 RepID=A0AAV7JFL4_9METZ|nr:hypothetical protein LOD99_8635 [Oopsacas minuta]